MARKWLTSASRRDLGRRASGQRSPGMLFWPGLSADRAGGTRGSACWRTRADPDRSRSPVATRTGRRLVFSRGWPRVRARPFVAWSRHLPTVLAIARRMLRDDAEAEDVAQETMLRLWRNAA